MRYVIYLSTVVLLACGNDDATGPEITDPPIVGRWESDTIEIDKAVFLSLGFSEEEFSDMERSINNAPRDVITFNADGTWVDNDNDRGTWRIEGDILTLTIESESGEVTLLSCEYKIENDRLTLFLTVEQFLSMTGLGLKEQANQNQILASMLFRKN